MGEKRVRFDSGRWALEGLYEADGTGKAVVITHPHPLYGGDMFSPVVEAIAGAYRRCGFATLRFNFRGTGNSTGHHSQGRGEQKDVAAAVDFVNTHGHAETHLAGYSFGAWVNALAMHGGLAIRRATMVAPPVAFIEFPASLHLPALVSVVAGSDDDFAPPSLIEPELTRWNPEARMDIIQGADHFFFGFLDEITRLLTAVLR